MKNLISITASLILLTLPATAIAKPEAAVSLKQDTLQTSSSAKNAKNEKNGIRIISVEKDSIYLKLGLQAGDLIQMVDGKPLKEINDLVKLVESLIQKGGKLKLKILRNGKSEVLDYNVEAG